MAGKRNDSRDGSARPAEAGANRGWLLLTALDPDAEAALRRALTRGDIVFEAAGPAVLVEAPQTELRSLGHDLIRLIAPGLQDRLKGAVLSIRPGDPASLMAALVQADPLPLLLDCFEFQWARTILEADSLYSVFQPIVESGSARVFAYEALIRARRDDTGEEVGAGQLIYACERLGLLHAVDERARRSAIAGGAALGSPDARFFVNFMPQTIYEPDLCLRSTVACAEEHNLDMDRLVFEIAESEQSWSSERLNEILSHYRRLGAGVALDDITAGFSSMQSVADLVPDYVKVDRHLVAAATTNRSARETLDNIVRVARRLNVRVVAVGVESAEQMKVCVDAGADYMQGFLFARPANPPEPVRKEAFAAKRRAA